MDQVYVKGKGGILQKLAYEVRYDFGFTYLDKCGRTINTILRDHPEWMIKADTPNPQAGSLVSIDNGCSFVFSPYNYTFVLEMPAGGEPLSEKERSEFVDQVELLSVIVSDSLGLEAFTRIGMRAWYLFSFDKLSESTEWLTSLGFYSISPDLSKLFEATLDAASVVVLLSSKERQYRLSFSSVERQVQLDLGQEILSIRASTLSKDQDKFLLRQLETRRRIHANPQFAALLDIDAFQEDPISIDARDFIENSLKDHSEKIGTWR